MLLGYAQSVSRHLMGLSQDARAYHPDMPAWQQACMTAPACGGAPRGALHSTNPLHVMLLLAGAMAGNTSWGPLYLPIALPPLQQQLHCQRQICTFKSQQVLPLPELSALRCWGQHCCLAAVCSQLGRYAGRCCSSTVPFRKKISSPACESHSWQSPCCPHTALQGLSMLQPFHFRATAEDAILATHARPPGICSGI